MDSKLNRVKLIRGAWAVVDPDGKTVASFDSTRQGNASANTLCDRLNDKIRKGK